MKKAKRIVIAAVILCMLFGLVGCGSSKYPVEELTLTIDQFSNPDYDYADYQKMFPKGFVVKKRNFENSRLRVTVSDTARDIMNWYADWEKILDNDNYAVYEKVNENGADFAITDKNLKLDLEIMYYEIGKDAPTGEDLEELVEILRKSVLKNVKSSGSNKNKDKSTGKIEYKTIYLKDIFDKGVDDIGYYACIESVIDDVEFKVPDDQLNNFFIRADFITDFDENFFKLYEKQYTAGKYEVYMYIYNSISTEYYIYNTETEMGLNFGHIINYDDEKTNEKILKTFNDALEDYITKNYK